MAVSKLTHRTILKGIAAAAPALALPAGLANAAPLFTAEETLRMRAEGIIYQYIAHGVDLVALPDGHVFSRIYIDGGQTDYECDVERRLNQELENNPDLKRQFMCLVREMHRLPGDLP